MAERVKRTTAVSVTIPVVTKERMRLRPGDAVYIMPTMSAWTIAAMQPDGVILRRPYSVPGSAPQIECLHCDWAYIRDHVRPSRDRRYLLPGMSILRASAS